MFPVIDAQLVNDRRIQLFKMYIAQGVKMYTLARGESVIRVRETPKRPTNLIYRTEIKSKQLWLLLMTILTTC